MNQKRDSRTDEMAAESEYFEYHGCLTGDCPHNSTKECLTHAYVTGCKHKTEQLSNGSVSFDEEAVLEEAALACFGQRDATRCVSHNFIKVARLQHAQLAPIINAQAERLKAAERLIEKLEVKLKRIADPWDIDAVIEKQADQALSEIEKFRKGEG